MQPSATLEELIASHSFLSGMNRHFLNLLETCASLRRFGSHQCIFEEGADADHFYLINSGKVALNTTVPGGAALEIHSLGAGDPLGWSWLFAPYKWRFSALTLMPTDVISFGAGFLRERAEEDLEFSNELLKRVARTMVERMNMMRQAVVNAYCSNHPGEMSTHVHAHML